MIEPITLEQYETAERALSFEEARRGLTVHSIVISVVSIILIAINVLFVPQFAWSPIAVAGMLIGVGLHYLFGFRWLGRFVESRQHAIERRAVGLRSA